LSKKSKTKKSQAEIFAFDAPAPKRGKKPGKVKKADLPPLSEWYRLDNAAKIYPATSHQDWNSTFRVSATLKEEIRPELLSQAVRDLAPRFPTFFVKLRIGFFWYYFEPAYSTDIVSEETTYPCRPIPIFGSEKPVFRVLYYKNRVSVEIFHAITDGSGALTFLKALVTRYLTLRGVDTSDARWSIPDMRDIPSPAETEDSFAKYYQNLPRVSRKEPRAYTYKGRNSQEEPFLRLISGTFSVEALKKLTREKGVTITQYLTALYILAFARHISWPARLRPVRISVPVNLRRMFPSQTLRNFSLFVNVGMQVTPDLTLDDILAVIVPQLEAGIQRDSILRVFSQNVRAERQLALRLTPLFIKNVFLQISFHRFGESRYTSTFSNLGRVELPPSVAEHVESFGFSLGGSRLNGIGATGISFGDRMTVCFSSTSPDNSIQADFFRMLAQNGLEVEVESNV
jgi:NRPS condensation-like uncharacterized protein